MAKYYSNATDLITFARSSSATYLDSDGVIKTAATDAPRIDYDADRSLKGLLIEEQRTNLLHNTDNPSTQVANLTAGSHTLSFYGGTSASSISDSITATAVDVFVYDTRNDSDGGAWRTGSLAQASSWYAEASSASRDATTRSTRAEFPAVAVIVAEASKVTIYDGDDPSLPMWMVFNNSGLLAYTSTTSSVTMLNGLLCIGAANGLATVDFMPDEMRFRQIGNDRAQDDISTRNTASMVVTGFANYIVNSTVNDVAMTVLPNAPTDPATGLPVPTIAIASDGGVSVIKDDGTVVDIHDGSSITGWVDFTDDGQIFFNEGGTVSAVSSYIGAIPSADVTSSLPSNFQRYRYDQAPYLNPVQALDGAIVAGGNLVYRKDGSGANAGLSILAPLPTNPTGGLVAGVTSSCNTGWMNGAIKLAALADTTAETLSGSELVTNGDFPAGLSDGDVGYDNGDGTVDGWTASTDVELSIVSGAIRVQNSATYSTGHSGSAVFALTTAPNKVYVLEATVVTANASGASGIGVSNSNGVGSFVLRELGSHDAVGAGTHTITFTATSSTTYLKLFNWTTVANYYADFDNVSVRLADPDRSVNGNGLAVYGSITKAAVATGADVVAYSGFSSSNYLEQPYNSDLDFGAYTGTAGTGDFCVMAWMKEPSGSVGYIFDRASSSGASRWYVQIDSFGHIASNGMTVTGNTRVVTDSLWHHVCVFRKNGITHLYIDGTIEGTPGSNSLNINGANEPSLYVGVRYSLAQPIDGLALLRISATAPTADQIAKIYEDEKLLFQPNAKATLDGTSDAVTALAYDSGTDLLHVGTNQSRSVFYGLRRINQTGTAVTTAISAVDGLISEQ